MRPGVEHRITVRLETRSGVALPEKTFAYTPPPLSGCATETPPFETRVHRQDAMEPGFLLLSVRRRTVTRALWWTEKQKRFAQRWSLLVALDPFERRSSGPFTTISASPASPDWIMETCFSIR